MNTKHILSGIAAAACALGAAAWLMGDSIDRSEPAEIPAAASAQLRAASRPPAEIEAASDVASAEAPMQTDSALLARIEHKYRYLFADWRAEPAVIEALKRRLAERETAAAALATAHDQDGFKTGTEVSSHIEEVLRADATVLDLLPPGYRDLYVALKDSDSEQHHLSEYSGGISHIEPLTPQQERAVFEARLRHKQRYETAVRDAGLDRDGLSLAEREYAHATVARALGEYRDDFLIEVSAWLSADQLTLLRNYETTEFAHELENLQQTINAK
jgi:hypothetical protein